LSPFDVFGRQATGNLSIDWAEEFGRHAADSDEGRYIWVGDKILVVVDPFLQRNSHTLFKSEMKLADNITLLSLGHLYPYAMSVDDYTDEAASQAAKGTDFKTDLKRIGSVSQQAIIQGQENHSDFSQSALDQTRALTDWFDQREVPPEQAIAAAWFFILSFD
jgi:hypothetical protein